MKKQLAELTLDEQKIYYIGQDAGENRGFALGVIAGSSIACSVIVITILILKLI